LPNGLRVLLVERHRFPVAAAQLVVGRGALDVDDAGGAKVMRMMHLYGRGGSEEAYEKVFDEARGAGVTYGTGASSSGAWVAARGPASELDTSLGVLEALSFGATLTGDEHRHRSAEWDEQASFRGMSVDRAERLILFGARHPLGFAGDGRDAFPLESAAQLRARLFQPRYSTLVVVGDVTPEKLAASAGAVFGGLPNPADLGLVAAGQTPLSAPALSVVIRRQLTQMHAGVFARGPSPASADFEVFGVAAEVLGGGHSSGLYEALRDEMGAAYTLGSGIQAERTASWWSFGASYQADKAVAGVATTLRAVAHLRDGGASAGELDAAKERLVAGWRESMATVQGAAAVYARAVLLGADIERVRDYPAQLARVAEVDVVRVANDYLRDGVLHVVFLGDDRGLDVEPLGMGGVVKVDETAH
jgi:zinc protease